MTPEWRIDDGLTRYTDAMAVMDARVAEIRAGTAPECVWLLEHPPLYTAGTSARDGDLLDPDRFEVHRTGRGGEHTYHGPGQRIGYVMLDLKTRGQDVRAYVHRLEAWVIAALETFNIQGETRPDRPGVWVRRPDLGREDKIAALGVRIRRWVTLHGVAINVEPDLSHFDGIVPCGIREHGVTSLVDLGIPATMADLDVALRQSWDTVFGA